MPAFAPLPGAAVQIEAALAARAPSGATPTAAALRGALGAAAVRAAAYPDHAVVVVLATDGVPDESEDASSGTCAPSDPATSNAEVAAIAAQGLAGTPPVPTFAIGVFTPDAEATGTAGLEALAAAGGSGRPFVVEALNTDGTDGGSSLETRFVQALSGVRSASLPCRYALPAPDAGAIDPEKINVVYTPGSPSSGPASTVPRVDTPEACQASAGWFLDRSDGGAGSAPPTVDFCPATCAAVRSDPGGRVELVSGCEAVVR
jgi:hypothetical protein